MKKAIYPLLIITVILFSACYIKGDDGSKKAADAFLSKFYTVTSASVQTYQASTPALGSESIESLSKPLKDLMTENEYNKVMVINRRYYTNVATASQYGCTITAGKSSLTQTDKSNGNIQYSYTITLQLTYTSTGETKSVIDTGSVILQQVSGKWKVNYIGAGLSQKAFSIS